MSVILRKTRISALYYWHQAFSIFWPAHRVSKIQQIIENIQRYYRLNKTMRACFSTLFSLGVTNLRFCAGKRHMITPYSVTDHVAYKYNRIIRVELDNNIR